VWGVDGFTDILQALFALAGVNDVTLDGDIILAPSVARSGKFKQRAGGTGRRASNAAIVTRYTKFEMGLTS